VSVTRVANELSSLDGKSLHETVNSPLVHPLEVSARDESWSTDGSCTVARTEGGLFVVNMRQVF